MKTRPILGITLGLLLLCGCANTSSNPLVRYASNRGLDFLDVFEIGVEAGPSFRVDLKYGFGFAGIGSQKAYLARLGQRNMVVESDWYEMAPMPFPLGAPLLGLLYPWDIYLPKQSLLENTLGHETETQTPIAGSLDDAAREGSTEVTRLACITLRGCRPTAKEVLWPKMFPIGGELMWLVGVRARVYPVELLDFAMGLFGLDVANDDGSPAVDDSTVTQ